MYQNLIHQDFLPSLREALSIGGIGKEVIFGKVRASLFTCITLCLFI